MFPDNNRTKICIKCNIEKSIDSFGKKKKNKSGYDNVCKSCNQLSFKEYYKNNTEKVRVKNKIYYNDNIDYYKSYQKIYQPLYVKTQNGYNKKRLIDHNRRIKLLKKENDGTITQYALDILINSQDYKCAYCGKEIIDNLDRHLDHINPLSKGGIHTISNVHWTCKTCNLRKNAKSHEEFINIIKGLKN